MLCSTRAAHPIARVLYLSLCPCLSSPSSRPASFCVSRGLPALFPLAGLPRPLLSPRKLPSPSFFSRKGQRGRIYFGMDRGACQPPTFFPPFFVHWHLALSHIRAPSGVCTGGCSRQGNEHAFGSACTQCYAFNSTCLLSLSGITCWQENSASSFAVSSVQYVAVEAKPLEIAPRTTLLCLNSPAKFSLVLYSWFSRLAQYHSARSLSFTYAGNAWRKN